MKSIWKDFIQKLLGKIEYLLVYKNKLTKISKLKSRILYDRQESELQILQCKIRYYKRYVVQQ